VCVGVRQRCETDRDTAGISCRGYFGARTHFHVCTRDDDRLGCLQCCCCPVFFELTQHTHTHCFSSACHVSARSQLLEPGGSGTSAYSSVCIETTRGAKRHQDRCGMQHSQIIRVVGVVVFYFVVAFMYTVGRVVSFVLGVLLF